LFQYIPFILVYLIVYWLSSKKKASLITQAGHVNYY
jgi:hypothetical protein